MKKKIIWYCHHYAGSPSRGMSYRPYYLTQAFRQAGHRAFVISASYHHLLQHPILQKEPLCYTDIDGVPFILLKTHDFFKNSVGRLLNMLSYVWRFFWNRKNIEDITGKPDVIIVSSGHPFHYRLLEKLARRYQATLIVEVRDLWPLSLIDLLKWPAWHPMVLWLAWIERRAYRQADYVVSLLEGAFPYMAARGLEKSRFRVIPNGTSVELFRSHRERDVDIQAVQEKNRFLIGYAGAIGEPNALHYLIDAMALLAEQQADLHCVILGDGPLKPALEKEVARLQLTTVTFLPPIPKYDIPTFLGGMDALYLGWNAVDIYQYGVSPNKLFDYMMSGKPIIESGGARFGILDEVGCGLRCEAASAEAIAATLLRMQSLSAAERTNMGLRGIQAVEKYYDYKVLAQQYSALF